MTYGSAPAVASSSSINTPSIYTEPLENSIAVYSFTSLRTVKIVPASKKPIMGSVLNPAGTKIVLAVPEEGKLKLWDVWGKPKEVRRHTSFMGCIIR